MTFRNFREICTKNLPNLIWIMLVNWYQRSTQNCGWYKFWSLLWRLIWSSMMLILVMLHLLNKALQDEIDYLLKNDFTKLSQSNWSWLCILIPKPGGTYCMYTDYRKVNNVTKSDTFSIPCMDDCTDRIGKFLSLIKLKMFQPLLHQMVFINIKSCLLE